MGSPFTSTKTPLDNIFEKLAVEDKATPYPGAPSASSPNLGGKQQEMYGGELLGPQLVAFLKWKETDDYKRAYYRKQKRVRERPIWVPRSREYQRMASTMDDIDSSVGKPWFVGSEEAEGDHVEYKSSEYKRDRKKKRPASSLQYEAPQTAYKSLEYQRAYPLRPVSAPHPARSNGTSIKAPAAKTVKRVKFSSETSSLAANEESADWI